MYLTQRDYEFPARIFLPSGHDKVFKTFKEAEDFAETLRKRYQEKLHKAKTPQEKSAAQEFYDDYLKLTNDLQHIRRSYHVVDVKGGAEPSYERLAKFPMRFTAPSGAIYTLNNFSDFKKFKDKDFWNKELEARASSKEYPATREKLMQNADADYRYLMGEREKLLSKGWQNKGHNPGWYLENNPLNALVNRQMADLKEGERREKELRGESKPWSFFNSQKSTENQTPPEATAEQPKPAEGNVPQARSQRKEKKAKVKEPIKIDEDMLSATLLSKIDSDDTLTDEQKRTFKIIAEDSHKIGLEKFLEDEKKLVEGDDSLTPEQIAGFHKTIEDYLKYKDNVTKALQEEQTPGEVEYETPHEEDEEGLYNTEQNVGVDPETLTRLGIQAESKRLARRPFKPNPYATEEPISEMEQESIDTFNRLSNEANLPRERGEQHETIQKLLKDYIDPSVMDQRAETLKDMLISKVRERAQQRLMKSYEKLGMKLSAAGMGRSGYEEKMRQEMAKEMEIELAEREFVEGMRIRQQEEENHRAKLNSAIQAYVLNQKEEEARKAEQTRAAINKLEAAKYASERIRRAKERQSEEFTREQEYPWRAQNQLADIINKTTRGEAKPVEPSLDEIKRPEVVPQAAPAAVEREIGPTHVPPALGHAPERDTTFADTTAAGLGLGKLVLDAYNTFGGGSKKEEAKT